MHYVLGNCMHPEACATTMSLSLCKTALQAISKYITQEVKNLHVHMHVFVSLVCNNEQICCFSSCALDTEGAECYSEGANVAPLTLDNQCISEIPLGGNTVAPQLISTAFFKTAFSMLTGDGLGEGKTKSMKPLFDFYVLAKDNAHQTCMS